MLAWWIESKYLYIWSHWGCRSQSCSLCFAAAFGSCLIQHRQSRLCRTCPTSILPFPISAVVLESQWMAINTQPTSLLSKHNVWKEWLSIGNQGARPLFAHCSRFVRAESAFFWLRQIYIKLPFFAKCQNALNLFKIQIECLDNKVNINEQDE